MRAADETVIGFIKILRDRTQERDQADRQRLLMHELGHRMKNTLSVVQSIATQSLRNAASLDDAAEKLQSRISAYAKAHDILLQQNWMSATLRNIVEAAKVNIGLEGSDRIKVEGPDVELGPQAALSFSLVLHELLTNASKYGALANSDGYIEMSWQIEQRADEKYLLSTWREIGGPSVGDPARKGFGSRLIVSSLQAYGEASIQYDPDGVDGDSPDAVFQNTVSQRPCPDRQLGKVIGHDQLEAIGETICAAQIFDFVAGEASVWRPRFCRRFFHRC